MSILKNGIYFKQYDKKVEGEYISDEKGDLIHKEYIKPRTWFKTKYFAKYGYKFNENTIYTSCFWFYPSENIICMQTISADAVTVAKKVRNKSPFDSNYKYSLIDNEVNFESDYASFKLILSNDGSKLKKHTIRKKDNKTLKTVVYSYLNWEMI